MGKQHTRHKSTPTGRSSGGSASKSGSSLRIIGGTHRGRKLPIPDLDGLRPTSDRVRETLFNWLQFDISGCDALDLFAGTGALGLESLSRGANSATFVEPQISAATAIKASLTLLKYNPSAVVVNKAAHFIQQTEQKFDLVFVDPPFSLNLWAETIANIEKSELLNDGGYLYVECPKHQAIEISGIFEILKEKTMGDVRFMLFQKKAI